ncbi:MAG TPA: helix-turn-helix transcriptional regulator [Aggregatilineales bacterium]|nr:helix-turn-helix transcriptional regulator [Anaerolineales bacterium]HRE49034.1 helix-turn-helix transcriptional regulator [Aggregatilineales bacterium]
MTFRINRLRATREEKGMSQVELSRRTGISNVVINRYEGGRSEPSIGNLVKFAEVLGVSTDYLLGLSHTPDQSYEMAKLDAPEADLVDAYRHGGWAGVLHFVAERLKDG